MARLAMGLVLMVALLAGCGQVVVFGHVVGEKPASVEPKPEAAPAIAPAAVPADAAETPAEQRLASNEPPIAHAVKSVNLTVTAEAAAKITGDASRFTADALLDALRTELKSRKLLDEQNPQASGTAEIIVDDLGTRSTSNVILFGYKMLAGTLEGDIRVTGAEGTASTGSRIVAESKLTVAANGEDKNPLGPLYRRFAVLAADRLAGVASKPQDPTGIPRF